MATLSSRMSSLTSPNRTVSVKPVRLLRVMYLSRKKPVASSKRGMMTNSKAEKPITSTNSPPAKPSNRQSATCRIRPRGFRQPPRAHTGHWLISS